MTEPLQVYPLTYHGGRWWLPHGPEADAERLARVFLSDCSVVFHGPEGGSFAYDITEEGEEVVSLDGEPWITLTTASLSPWQKGALQLTAEAIDNM